MIAIHRAAKAGRLASILAGLVACGARDELYPIPLRQARDALEGTEIPEAVIGGGAHATAARIVGNDILWYAETDGGKRLLQLWVRLEQVGEGTRARVEIAHNSAEIAANLADHPEVERMFAALVHEQVDATLTDRAFEFANVSNEVAAALRPMQPTVEAGFRAAEASDKRARAEAIDRAYNEAARSRHQELDGTGSDFDEEAEMQGWAAGQE